MLLELALGTLSSVCVALAGVASGSVVLLGSVASIGMASLGNVKVRACIRAS